MFSCGPVRRIPIQCIAVNGPSIVNNVRFVAASLLDAVQTGDEVTTPDTSGNDRSHNGHDDLSYHREGNEKSIEDVAGTNRVTSLGQEATISPSVLRAQTYLLDFLSLLSEIEKNYQLDEELTD